MRVARPGVMRPALQACWTGVFAALAIAGCSSGNGDGDPSPMQQPSTNAGTGAPSPAAGSGSNPTTNDPPAGKAGSGGPNPSPMAGSGGSGTPPMNSGAGQGAPKPEEMLDPSVDWTALSILYDRMYTAYDGVHTFQVPARVDGQIIEPSGWKAIPSSAVMFEADPEGGGVLITVLEPVAEITIAASAGPVGGKAPLRVTVGTPEDWAMGEARYNNGVEYELPDLDFAEVIFDPNWQPPEAPDNLACNNCHTTGAKYFEIQHTPTQASRISDEELIKVFTEGVKPPGVGYRILPESLQDLYVDFHTWVSTPEEQKGLIIYLRSLTPQGQGDIKLPDGSYVPPGTPMP